MGKSSIISLVKLIIFSLAAGAALFAQTPAPKAAPKAPAAKAPVKAAPKAATKTAPAKPAGPPRALLTPATLKATAPEMYKVRFTTTRGDFVLQVNRAWAPLGADRFYNLVRNGFFTDTAFFRVVRGFVVQFGLSTYPAVSRVWKMANIQDDAVRESNKRGTISFATAGPNTRTTQVFVNLVDNGRLDSMGFSPFGQIVEGMDIVDQLYNAYGESPEQGSIQNEGKPYLDKNFPLLDTIKAATIIEPAAPPTPAVKPATKAPAGVKPATVKPAAAKSAAAATKAPAAAPTKK